MPRDYCSSVIPFGIWITCPVPKPNLNISKSYYLFVTLRRPGDWPTKTPNNIHSGCFKIIVLLTMFSWTHGYPVRKTTRKKNRNQIHSVLSGRITGNSFCKNHPVYSADSFIPIRLSPICVILWRVIDEQENPTPSVAVFISSQMRINVVYGFFFFYIRFEHLW